MKTPTFTIVIPTRGRPTQLSSCLEAIALLDYERDKFEIIVVDDGSPEPIDDRVASFRDRLNITLLCQTNAGPSAARNAAAAVRGGRFLAFTDDDVRPKPDWLRRLAEHFLQHPDCLVGGRVCNALTDNPYSTTSQLIMDSAYSFYNQDPNDARFIASCNMAMPAVSFLDIGGFDAAFRIASEDRDLCDRWRHRGYRMRYASEAVVLHAHRLSLGSFWRQHFRYGRGAWRFHRARSRRGGRLTRELRTHARFLSVVRAKIPARRRFVIIGLLGVWQVANLAGFLYEWLRPDKPVPSEATVS